MYIVALQRVASAPTYEHVRKLNKLVRIVKARSTETVYHNMTCCKSIVIHSDSAFRREVDKGYAMRGAAYMRVGRKDGWTGARGVPTERGGSEKLGFGLRQMRLSRYVDERVRAKGLQRFHLANAFAGDLSIPGCKITHSKLTHTQLSDPFLHIFFTLQKLQ